MNGEPQGLVMSLNVLRVSEISQKSQTYKMHYIIAWTWRDCRVLHGCLYLTIDDNHELFNKFWRPALRIQEREDDNSDMLIQRHTLWGHGYDGFTEEHVSKFRCSFDFTDMPFDIQKCKLTFTVPGMPIWQMYMAWNRLVGENLTNSEWVIDQPEEWQTGSVIEKVMTEFGEAEVSKLTAEFKLTRKSRFLINNYVGQAAAIYTVSWVGLWIDKAAVPARAAIGVIPVLVIINKMSAYAAAIPPIAYATRLESFMVLTLVMIALNMMEYGVVHFAGRVYKMFSEIAKQKEQQARVHAEEESTGVVGDMAEKPLRHRMGWIVLKFTTLHFEVHMRWMSPLMYAVIAGIILEG